MPARARCVWSKSEPSCKAGCTSECLGAMFWLSYLSSVCAAPVRKACNNPQFQAESWFSFLLCSRKCLPGFSGWVCFEYRTPAWFLTPTSGVAGCICRRHCKVTGKSWALHCHRQIMGTTLSKANHRHCNVTGKPQATAMSQANHRHIDTTTVLSHCKAYICYRSNTPAGMPNGCGLTWGSLVYSSMRSTEVMSFSVSAV